MNDEATYRPATLLVHAGTERTPYGETSEAMFLTSGFVYDSAELGIFSAPRVAWTLRVFGHPSVHLLNNYKLWVEQGHEVEAGEQAPVERRPAAREPADGSASRCSSAAPARWGRRPGAAGPVGGIGPAKRWLRC